MRQFVPKPGLLRATFVLAAMVMMAWLAALSFGREGLAQEVQFTEAYLRNPENIARGKDVWSKRCKFCHGKVTYPGKGPKLRPSRYTPEFIYYCVTYGFGTMPSWTEEFSEEQRMGVAAYVLSKEFSP